jgi:Synergist-CTERM protein sorting domain-containing protein
MRHLLAAVSAAAVCNVASIALADLPAPSASYCGSSAAVGSACSNAVANDSATGTGTCQDAGMTVLLDAGTRTAVLTCTAASSGGCSSGGSLFGPWLIALVAPVIFWRRRRRVA